MHTIENTEYGIEARIVELRNGSYCVTLRDTEANEVLPTGKIFSVFEDARNYAIKITN